MKQVKILGTGCANCRHTLALVEQVAREKGVPIELEKVETLPEILRYGVMSTPGVVIDGQWVKGMDVTVGGNAGAGVAMSDDGQHWIVDLKTTGTTASPDRFGASAASYGYHLQAAFYLDGYEQITGHRARFLNVLVETAAPHFVAVVELDDEALDVGRAKYRDALDIYARCRESGDWPGYTPTFTEVVSLPRWATYI